eukprot:CAMPEP_0206017322 /NCGR_PEP_ID=MMETSP1464-20131121/24808_1 /ASSEMBLY_ACC=CAM_ASM_001124 /TAXON_ID=119497 /ORGANISM="Exanthemachrysis gayraliae, Strain RCC1523" /LENGTH=162 /DNA_ID=CAMNT_0053391169 /DNA_START=188 /DNA_END=672 /DNA_ORIENTATION=+
MINLAVLVSVCSTYVCVCGGGAPTLARTDRSVPSYRPTVQTGLIGARARSGVAPDEPRDEVRGAAAVGPAEGVGVRDARRGGHGRVVGEVALRAAARSAAPWLDLCRGLLPGRGPEGQGGQGQPTGALPGRCRGGGFRVGVLWERARLRVRLRAAGGEGPSP